MKKKNHLHNAENDLTNGLFDCLNLLMTCVRTVFLPVAVILCACSKSPENPQDAANEFLRAVHRRECEKIFASFSIASQENVRSEAAQARKAYPPYAAEFTPENFYCTSVFANHFLTLNRGSAKLQKIEGSNAVVTVTYTQGKNELIPGFFPTKFERVPMELNLVKEGGAWKIDLARPTTREREVLAAKQRALDREKEASAEYLKRRSEASARATNVPSSEAITNQ